MPKHEPLVFKAIAFIPNKTDKNISDENRKHYERFEAKASEVGDILLVKDTVGKWYNAKVIEVEEQQQIKVHYLGWSDRWDTWVDYLSQKDDVLPARGLELILSVSSQLCTTENLQKAFETNALTEALAITKVKPALLCNATKTTSSSDISQATYQRFCKGKPKPGDRLDVQDRERNWYSATACQVTYVNTYANRGRHVRFKFDGWSSKYNEKLSCPSNGSKPTKVAPLGSKTMVVRDHFYDIKNPETGQWHPAYALYMLGSRCYFLLLDQETITYGKVHSNQYHDLTAKLHTYTKPEDVKLEKLLAELNVSDEEQDQLSKPLELKKLRARDQIDFLDYKGYWLQAEVTKVTGSNTQVDFLNMTGEIDCYKVLWFGNSDDEQRVAPHLSKQTFAKDSTFYYVVDDKKGFLQEPILFEATGEHHKLKVQDQITTKIVAIDSQDRVKSLPYQDFYEAAITKTKMAANLKKLYSQSQEFYLDKTRHKLFSSLSQVTDVASSVEVLTKLPAINFIGTILREIEFDSEVIKAVLDKLDGIAPQALRDYLLDKVSPQTHRKTIAAMVECYQSIHAILTNYSNCTAKELTQYYIDAQTSLPDIIKAVSSDIESQRLRYILDPKRSIEELVVYDIYCQQLKGIFGKERSLDQFAIKLCLQEKAAKFNFLWFRHGDMSISSTLSILIKAINYKNLDVVRGCLPLQNKKDLEQALANLFKTPDSNLAKELIRGLTFASPEIYNLIKGYNLKADFDTAINAIIIFLSQASPVDVEHKGLLRLLSKIVDKPTRDLIENSLLSKINTSYVANDSDEDTEEKLTPTPAVTAASAAYKKVAFLLKYYQALLVLNKVFQKDFIKHLLSTPDAELMFLLRVFSNDIKSINFPKNLKTPSAIYLAMQYLKRKMGSAPEQNQLEQFITLAAMQPDDELYNIPEYEMSQMLKLNVNVLAAFLNLVKFGDFESAKRMIEREMSVLLEFNYFIAHVIPKVVAKDASAINFLDYLLENNLKVKLADISFAVDKQVSKLLLLKLVKQLSGDDENIRAILEALLSANDSAEYNPSLIKLFISFANTINEESVAKIIEDITGQPKITKNLDVGNLLDLNNNNVSEMIKQINDPSQLVFIYYLMGFQKAKLSNFKPRARLLIKLYSITSAQDKEWISEIIPEPARGHLIGDISYNFAKQELQKMLNQMFDNAVNNIKPLEVRTIFSYGYGDLNTILQKLKSGDDIKDDWWQLIALQQSQAKANVLSSEEFSNIIKSAADRGNYKIVLLLVISYPKLFSEKFGDLQINIFNLLDYVAEFKRICFNKADDPIYKTLYSKLIKFINELAACKKNDNEKSLEYYIHNTFPDLADRLILLAGDLNFLKESVNKHRLKVTSSLIDWAIRQEINADIIAYLISAADFKIEEKEEAIEIKKTLLSLLPPLDNQFAFHTSFQSGDDAEQKIEHDTVIKKQERKYLMMRFLLKFSNNLSSSAFQDQRWPAIKNFFQEIESYDYIFKNIIVDPDFNGGISILTYSKFSMDIALILCALSKDIFDVLFYNMRIYSNAELIKDSDNLLLENLQYFERNHEHVGCERYDAIIQKMKASAVKPEEIIEYIRAIFSLICLSMPSTEQKLLAEVDLFIQQLIKNNLTTKEDIGECIQQVVLSSEFLQTNDMLAVVAKNANKQDLGQAFMKAVRNKNYPQILVLVCYGPELTDEEKQDEIFKDETFKTALLKELALFCKGFLKNSYSRHVDFQGTLKSFIVKALETEEVDWLFGTKDKEVTGCLEICLRHAQRFSHDNNNKLAADKIEELDRFYHRQLGWGARKTTGVSSASKIKMTELQTLKAKTGSSVGKELVDEKQQSAEEKKSEEALDNNAATAPQSPVATSSSHFFSLSKRKEIDYKSVEEERKWLRSLRKTSASSQTADKTTSTNPEEEKTSATSTPTREPSASYSGVSDTSRTVRLLTVSSLAAGVVALGVAASRVSDPPSSGVATGIGPGVGVDIGPKDL